MCTFGGRRLPVYLKPWGKWGYYGRYGGKNRFWIISMNTEKSSGSETSVGDWEGVASKGGGELGKSYLGCGEEKRDDKKETIASSVRYCWVAK